MPSVAEEENNVKVESVNPSTPERVAGDGNFRRDNGSRSVPGSPKAERHSTLGTENSLDQMDILLSSTSSDRLPAPISGENSSQGDYRSGVSVMAGADGRAGVITCSGHATCSTFSGCSCSVTCPVHQHHQQHPPVLSQMAATTTVTSTTLSSPVQVGVDLANIEDSDSDLGQQQPLTSNSRSRQKKFLKNFKQLPQEEVVLQRYSCALVSDILLQGHLYITENYFAFYSNVFGYITKLQIPIRSVTKVTKEKTAKIIPNAIGLMTVEHEKHIFSSLLSRDTTFKLMNRLWKRAMRDSGAPSGENCILEAVPNDIALVPDLDLEADIEDIPDDLTTDSEEGGHIGGSDAPVTSAAAPVVQPATSDVTESSYLVKRMSQSNGTIFYQTRGGVAAAAAAAAVAAAAAKSSKKGWGMEYGQGTGSEINGGRRSSSSNHSTLGSNGNGNVLVTNILSHMTRSTIISVFVIVLLLFLFCSSIYLVFRIDSLEKQVESHYHNSYQEGGGVGQGADLAPKSSLSWDNIIGMQSSKKVQKVLDSNVDQISTVRKSLEKISSMLDRQDHEGKEEL